MPGISLYFMLPELCLLKHNHGACWDVTRAKWRGTLAVFGYSSFWFICLFFKMKRQNLNDIKIRLVFHCFNHLFFSWLFIYFERERGKAQAEEGQTVRERENPKQAPHCQHRARHGTWTHQPWDHDLSGNQETVA